MIEQCALYVPCSRCRYGRNLGYGEYECRESLAPDGRPYTTRTISAAKGERKNGQTKRKDSD